MIMQKRWFLIVLFLALTLYFVNAQDTIKREYIIEYGSLPNIESGAISSIHINSLIFDQINKGIQSNHNKWWLRTINFCLFQCYLGIPSYATIPHEFFGHHSRAMEFGINPKMTFSFPAIGGDNIFFVNYNTPAIQRQFIVSAGPELTSQIAYGITKDMYADEAVPSYYGWMLLSGKIIDAYLYTQSNLKSFIENPNQYYKENNEYFGVNPVPNDPLSYALALTERYGYYDNFIDKNSIWVQQFTDMSVYKNDFLQDQFKRMKTTQLLQLFDPTLLFFIYGNYNYLVKGNPFTKALMFNVSGVKFMPSIRANLGELGAENYFDMFFKIKKMPAFNIYYRQGGNLFHEIKGTGIEIRNINLIKDKLKLSSQLDYWYNEKELQNGLNVYEDIKAYPTKKWLVKIGIGYKSEGGLMGKPYREGLYGNIGVGLILNYRQKIQ